MFERIFVAVIYGLPLLLIFAVAVIYIAFSYQCPHGITGEPGCMWP